MRRVMVALVLMLVACGESPTDPSNEVPQLLPVARDGTTWDPRTEVHYFSDRGNECYVATHGEKLDMQCKFGEG